MKPISPTQSRPLVNLGYLVAGQTASGLCQFGRLTVLARYLGPFGYGEWGLAVALVALFMPLADFGFSTIGVRELARGSHPGRFLGTALGLKAALTVFLFGPICLSAVLLGAPLALVSILAAQMFAGTFAALVQVLFRSRERMALDSVLSALTALASLALTVALVHRGAGADALAAAYLGATTAGLLVALAIARRGYLPSGISWGAREARALVVVSWPLAAGMMATVVYWAFDRVLMGVLGQQVEIGWYTVAYTPILWLSGVVGMVRMAFLPAQSRAFAAGRDPSALLQDYGRLSMTLALPVAIFGAAYARPFLVHLYGPGYAGGALALRLLFVTAAVMFASSFFGSNLLAADRQKVYLRGVVVGAVTNIALNSFLVPLWSLNGAALATLASEAMVMLFMARACREWLRPADLKAIWARPFAVAMGNCVVLALCLAYLPLLAAVATCALGYLASALAVGLLKAPDLSHETQVTRAA